MTQQNALNILQSLANGIDPTTAEVFPSDSPYQDVEVTRALFYAVDVIRNGKKKPAKVLPGNAGLSWDKTEESELIEAFQAGNTVPQLAELHQRTKGAITARLTRLGLINR